MAYSAMSYELYISKLGVPGGVATLGPDGIVPDTQLPPSSVNIFQGSFADLTNLQTAVPVGQMAWFAYVTADLAFYYWDTYAEAWANQNVNEVAYTAMSDEEKSVVPWIVIPMTTP